MCCRTAVKPERWFWVTKYSAAAIPASKVTIIVTNSRVDPR